MPEIILDFCGMLLKIHVSRNLCNQDVQSQSSGDMVLETMRHSVEHYDAYYDTSLFKLARPTKQLEMRQSIEKTHF